MAYNVEWGKNCRKNEPCKRIDVPFCGRIVAGKNTYVYDAHTYHTKVPPEGIEQLIDYYTDPGDTVLDPFCGSGMTGVAALRRERNVLLSDLSPAATFIARNLTSPIDAERYWTAVQELLSRGEELRKQLYTTKCRECGKDAEVLYTVWSYNLICSACKKEFCLWDVARDERKSVKESKIRTEFNCPHCSAFLKKRLLRRTTLHPVAVGYKCCEKSLKEKMVELTADDLSFISGLDYSSIPQELWYPQNPFPKGVNTSQPISNGIDTIEKSYFPRALWAFSFLWNEANNWNDKAIREKLLFTLTSLYQRITKFSEFRFWGGSGNTANYNVPQIINEQNVFLAFERKAKTIYLYFSSEKKHDNVFCEVSTQSACHLNQLDNSSIDYVFTDPPFGANINYSEMNYLWESWLNEFTDSTEEAIVNKVQGKNASDYGNLMRDALSEIQRVLKPGGWLTLMFHNSSDRIWKELQNAIIKAGFSIDGIVLFDKVHGTFKQFVSDNAVGLDLVLNCKKKEHSSCSDYSISVIKTDEEQEAVSFAMQQLVTHSEEEYTVHYEHVRRADEFNFRKLYSEWLASIVDKEIVAVDFERFRLLVSRLLK